MPRKRNFPASRAFCSAGAMTSRTWSYCDGGTACNWNTSTQSTPSRRSEASRLASTLPASNRLSPAARDALVHTTTKSRGTPRSALPTTSSVP